MHQALSYGNSATSPKIGDRVQFRVPAANRLNGASRIFPNGLTGTVTEVQDQEGLVTVKLAGPWFFERKTPQDGEKYWVNARGQAIGSQPPHAFVYVPGLGKGMKVVSAIPILPHMLALVDADQPSAPKPN